MTQDPKQLVVLSGKGGAGKTSVTAALAHLASQEMAVSLADADVDAANLELVLGPEREATHDFASGLLAHVDAATCIACGECEAACRFDAIHPSSSLSSSKTKGNAYEVDPIACEGCAACHYRCPVGAIEMTEPVVGQWFLSRTPYGPLYHAHLFAGGENSGKLVTLVKQQARLRALDDARPLVLVDGPPGIGCPVISAASGATLALLVVEPTPAGAHDLARVLELTRHFEVPALALLNKADLSAPRAAEIAAFCARQQAPIVANLPYDPIVTKAMVNGQAVTAYTDAPVTQALHAAWAEIKARLGLT